jgi:hypothetical protein
MRHSKHLTVILLGLILDLTVLSTRGGVTQVEVLVFVVGLLVIGITSIHWLVTTKRGSSDRVNRKKSHWLPQPSPSIEVDQEPEAVMSGTHLEARSPHTVSDMSPEERRLERMRRLTMALALLAVVVWNAVGRGTIPDVALIAFESVAAVCLWTFSRDKPRVATRPRRD